MRFLNDRQKEFWKQLYFGGLSEFFYINGIETDKDSFMTIECDEAKDDIAPICYKTAGINLIPVGGGKDSAVTAELLKPFGKRNKFSRSTTRRRAPKPSLPQATARTIL